jgi:hypothetical protein
VFTRVRTPPRITPLPESTNNCRKIEGYQKLPTVFCTTVMVL